MDTLTIFTILSFLSSLFVIPGIALLNFRSDYTDKDTNYKALNKAGKWNRAMMVTIATVSTLFSLAAMVVLRFL